MSHICSRNARLGFQAMTREEWQRIKRVSTETLKQPAAERPAFVSRACGGDPTLEREVVSLVASVEHTSLTCSKTRHGTFAMRGALAPGALILGPYEVVERIGAGAMGEVYGEGSALARGVAIKVLPIWSRRSRWGARFETEARSAAASPIQTSSGSPTSARTKARRNRERALGGESLRERIASAAARRGRRRVHPAGRATGWRPRTKRA